jgi:hypothetical protein
MISLGRPRLTRRATLLLPVLAASCSHPPKVQTVFPPLTYGYLTKIRLITDTLDIDQTYVPPDISGQIANLAPVPPATALRQMAHDRLLPGSTPGKATFKIEDASVLLQHATLRANFAVSLTVTTADGTRSGYAEARATHTATLLQDDPDVLRAALYSIVRAGMEDMNVEFEYQVRHSLHDYLQLGPNDEAAPGTAPPPPPVQSQDIAPPPAPPPQP